LQPTTPASASRPASSPGASPYPASMSAVTGTSTLRVILVIAANISESSVRQLRPDAATVAVIASGYLESERPALAGFDAVERRVLQGWAADLFRRAE